MDIDIGSLMEAVGLQNSRAAEIGAQITGNYSQVQALSEIQAESAARSGNADALVSEQQGLGQLKAQENARKYATAVGSNMDDSAEIMTALGMQYKEAAVQAISARNVVAEKSKIGLLDDPVQYIVNQITLGDDMNAADAAQAKADEISRSLAAINASTQQTAVTQNAIAVTKTAASVAAAAESIKAKAHQQAAKIHQDGMLYQIQNLDKLANMGQQQLQNLFSAKSAVNADKQLDMAMASLEQSRASFKLQLEERQARMDAKQETLDETNMLGNTINAGRASLGLAPIPTTKAIQMMKMGGDLGEQIKHQYSIGALAEATGFKVIDENPGKAAITIAKTQAPLAPGMQPVRSMLLGALTAATQDKLIDLKDQNAVAKKTNEIAKAQASLMAGNIKMGDATNIYAPPDLPSIVKAVPAAAETELYKKVLAPLVTTGLQDFNPTQIIALGSKAVNNGTLRFEDLVMGMVTLGSAAAATNNAVKDYIRVGLPKQVGFNTTVTIKNANTPDALSFATNENTKINLTDPVSVGSVVSKQMRKQMVGSISWVTPRKDESGTNRFFMNTPQN